MRPAGLPGGPLLRGRRGKWPVLGDDAPGAGREALAGGDADLHGLLDAVRDGGDAVRDALGDARDALGHDILAPLRLALDGAGLAREGAAVAAHEALDARAGELRLALAAALEAADVLLQLAAAAAQGLLRIRHGAVAVDQAGGEADDAVTRLQHAADVHERGALGDVAALRGRGLRGAGIGVRGLAGLRAGAAAGATSCRLRRRLGGRAGVRARAGGARRARLAGGRLARGGLAAAGARVRVGGHGGGEPPSGGC